jgi:hypothetical protein
MIILLFAGLAGLFKSIADVLDFNFNESKLFRYTDNHYINPEYSWKNKHKFEHMFGLIYLITPFSDAWHLCYTLMISSLICIGPFYTTLLSFNVSTVMNNVFTCMLIALTYGVCFEVTKKYLLT